MRTMQKDGKESKGKESCDDQTDEPEQPEEGLVQLTTLLFTQVHVDRQP